MRSFLAVLLTFFSAHAAFAECGAINLDGTYLESYSQNPSLTDAESHREGSVSRRLWKFDLGRVTVVEQFLDSKGCDLNDSRCTYFQVAVDFKTLFDPAQCQLKLEALSRQETFLRSFGEPEHEHYETIRHYSLGQKTEEFQVTTQGNDLRFWMNQHETRLLRMK